MVNTSTKYDQRLRFVWNRSALSEKKQGWEGGEEQLKYSYAAKTPPGRYHAADRLLSKKTANHTAKRYPNIQRAAWCKADEG